MSATTPRLGVGMLRESATVIEQRGAVYAHPSIDFGRVARIKAVLAECPDPLARHALEMIAVKMARLINTPDHRDSWVDIAGYSACGLDVTAPPPSAEPIEVLEAAKEPNRPTEQSLST